LLLVQFNFASFSDGTDLRLEPLVNPCLSAPYNGMPFCNMSLSLDDRVDDLVGRLSMQEKATALGTDTKKLSSVGLNAYNWWSEATHGISHVQNNDVTPAETNFALPVTTAGSFNRSLWFETGLQIGREGRAFMNVGNAGSTFWAPVINMIRDPRWGRNVETPGGDPYLTGQYAINFVKGMERNPEDPRYIQASACCKHYVANSMEDTTENGIHHARNEFDATVSPQDLVDTYMAPFQDCVEQGKVSGLMCSYNAVNGIPSCANGWLLDTVARGEWGFDGYVTSDCDADHNVFDPHHYTETAEESVKAVLEAGTDVDCGGWVTQNIQSAMDKGLVSEQLVDKRLKFLFRVRMRLQHFDPPGFLQSIKPDVVCSDYAMALSRDGTVQGSVLLKNDKNTLPLNPRENMLVAVIGPNSNLSEAIAGYYGGKPPCNNAYTNLVDAIAQYADVRTLLGVPSVSSGDMSGIDAAVDLAKKADVVVLGVGSDLSLEREGHDRTTIGFSEAQKALISRVSAAAKKIIMVTFGGGLVDVADQLKDDNVGAILHVAQPGVTVLGAGDLIFGHDVPAGRLIQMMYPEDFVDQVSIFDMNMRPGPSVWPAPNCNQKPCGNGTNPGRTHRFYTGKPTLPFGYGLSYSTFKYSVIRGPTEVSLDAVRRHLDKHSDRTFAPKVDEPLVQYSVNVTNTGSVDAADVVLGFLTPPGAGENGVPLQSLFGFERVFVKAGETKQVSLGAGLHDFTLVHADGKRRASPGKWTVKFGVKETLPRMGFQTHEMMAF